MARSRRSLTLDAERRRLRGDPGQVLVAGGGVDHDPEEVLGQEIDDQVVDHAALLVEHARVERLARHLCSLSTELATSLRRKARTLRAVQVDARSCARRRTCRHRGAPGGAPRSASRSGCGMSQPPKSTILAPRARWVSLKMVLLGHRRSGSAGRTPIIADRHRPRANGSGGAAAPPVSDQRVTRSGVSTARPLARAGRQLRAGRPSRRHRRS